MNSNKTVWLADRVEQLHNRYSEEGPTKLAREWGLTPEAVKIKASRLGIKRALLADRWMTETVAEGASCDHGYFDNWSPSSAYVLGYTFADGCVASTGYTLAYHCHAKDCQVLEYVKGELKSKSPVVFLEAESKYGRNNGPSVTLQVCSVVLCKKLTNVFGIHPAKTYRDDPFPAVPSEFLPHFVRGYYDGDGSIHHSLQYGYKLTFEGTPKFLHSLNEAVSSSVGLKPGNVYPASHNCHTLRYGNKRRLLPIYRWLYGAPGFFLPRKKARWDKLVNKFGNRGY